MYDLSLKPSFHADFKNIIFVVCYLLTGRLGDSRENVPVNLTREESKVETKPVSVKWGKPSLYILAKMTHTVALTVTPCLHQKCFPHVFCSYSVISLVKSHSNQQQQRTKCHKTKQKFSKKLKN